MIIIIVIVVFLFYFSFLNLNLNPKKKRPPSPITLPIIGNLVSLLNNQPQNILFNYYKKYGKIYQLQYGIVNTVVLSEFDILKEAFIENGDIFIERFNKITKKFKSSENIVNSNGLIWKKLQSISIQELSPNIKIKKYEPMIINETKKLIDSLNENIKSSESIDPTLNIKICFLNIILSFLFNFRFHDYKNEKVIQLVDHIHAIFRMGSHPIPQDYIPILNKFYINKTTKIHQKIFENLYEYIENQVQKRLEILTKNNNNNNIINECFVDLLLLKFKSNLLTWNEVIKTTTDLMIAGSDTNSLFTIHLIIALTNRENIQNKVFNEILSFDILNENNKITFSNKSKTPYYNSVLKEVERRYTVSPLSQPHRTNKDIILNGYFIPSGSQIIQNVYSCHLNDKDWENPFQFNPDRFLNNNNQLEKKLITFGIGPRNCLGFQFALMSIWIVNLILFKSIKFSSNKLIEEEIREGGTTLSPFPFKINLIKR
ncbi:hypothetical protein ACTFIR_011606 [Dictyostelium discoideum]